MTFHVDGAHMGEVMKYVSNYNILTLEVAPPTLEDLFIHHYQGER